MCVTVKADFQRGSANSWILNCPVTRSLYFYRDEESVKRYGNKDKEFLASTMLQSPEPRPDRLLQRSQVWSTAAYVVEVV